MGKKAVVKTRTRHVTVQRACGFPENFYNLLWLEWEDHAPWKSKVDFSPKCSDKSTQVLQMDRFGREKSTQT